jgi:cytochrome c-type biogenesis protein
MTKIGGGFLILIGVLQVTGLWLSVMNSFRDLISGFLPVV